MWVILYTVNSSNPKVAVGILGNCGQARFDARVHDFGGWVHSSALFTKGSGWGERWSKQVWPFVAFWHLIGFWSFWFAFSKRFEPSRRKANPKVCDLFRWFLFWTDFRTHTLVFPTISAKKKPTQYHVFLTLSIHQSTFSILESQSACMSSWSLCHASANGKSGRAWQLCEFREDCGSHACLVEISWFEQREKQCYRDCFCVRCTLAKLSALPFLGHAETCQSASKFLNSNDWGGHGKTALRPLSTRNCNELHWLLLERCWYQRGGCAKCVISLTHGFCHSALGIIKPTNWFKIFIQMFFFMSKDEAVVDITYPYC